MHNRCLHGYGVACGLDVSIMKGIIRVSPGLALSCTGDEIVVDEWLEISLPETRSSAYLTIRYQETRHRSRSCPGKLEVLRIPG